jgi:hypothetical protein
LNRHVWLGRGFGVGGSEGCASVAHVVWGGACLGAGAGRRGKRPVPCQFGRAFRKPRERRTALAQGRWILAACLSVCLLHRGGGTPLSTNWGTGDTRASLAWGRLWSFRFAARLWSFRSAASICSNCTNVACMEAVQRCMFSATALHACLAPGHTLHSGLGRCQAELPSRWLDGTHCWPIAAELIEQSFGSFVGGRGLERACRLECGA